MSKRNVIHAAEQLETKAWSVAKKIGYERTADNAGKFGRIIDGIIKVGWAGAESDLDASTRAIYEEEFRKTNNLEQSIALVMFGAVANIAGEYTANDEAWKTLCAANYALGTIEGRIDRDLGKPLEMASLEKTILRTRGMDGAHAKLANDRDGKQAAKSEVKECWDNWQQKPESYKSKAAFAKNMLEKYESLENQNSITRWCRDWEKAAKNSTLLAG